MRIFHAEGDGAIVEGRELREVLLESRVGPVATSYTREIMHVDGIAPMSNRQKRPSERARK